MQFFQDFTAWLLHQTGPEAVVAAGHGSGYVLDKLASGGASIGPIILLSPTWRGPLPTVMGQRPALYSLIGSVGNIPVIGDFLYRANTSRRFIGFMYRRHVFVNADFTDNYLFEATPSHRLRVGRGSIWTHRIRDRRSGPDLFT